MSVELITHDPSTVLDLTTEETTETTEVVTDTTITDEQTEETTDVVTETEESTEESTEEGTEETETTDEDQTDDTDEESEYYFGEEAVKVEVPDEIASALEEAGVDAKDVLSQLFKKDGDFTLDEATKTKLEDKFGKTLVDGYLNMYKNMNEATAKAVATAKDAATATEAQQGTEYAEAVGGIEGLESMESYILDNMDENQVAAYNAVMESGDHTSQMFVISQVKAQMQLADKLANGDTNIELLGDKAASSTLTTSPLDKGFITNDEYNQIMLDDKYWEDSEYSAKVDAARSAGIRKQV